MKIYEAIEKIQALITCGDVNKENNCLSSDCQNCSICYEIGTVEDINKLYKELLVMLDELDAYRKHIFCGDMTQRMLKSEYDNGYIDGVKEGFNYILFDWQRNNIKDIYYFEKNLNYILKKKNEG